MRTKDLETPQLVTAAQAAETLAISTRQLLRLKSRGTLPYVQMGRSVRYRMADIASFIESQTKQNKTL